MDHEKYFIGQILQEPDLAYKTMLKDTDFTYPSCRQILLTVRSLLKKGVEVDLPALHAANKELQLSLLMELQDSVVSASNWKHYEKAIKEASQRRGIRRVCERVLKDNLMTSQDMVMTIMEAVDGYKGVEEDRIYSIQETLNESVDEIEFAYNNKGKLLGVASGIRSLDRKLNGFQKRRLYVIGARPSRGKTALLMNFVLNADGRVGVLSAESGRRELTKRLISLSSRVNSEYINQGELGDAGFTKVTDACTKLYEKNIWWYDKPNMHLDELMLKAREMKQMHDIEVLYVDYVQQIQADAQKDHERVGKVSTALKSLARTLDIPVVTAAQLKRPGEGKGKPPELHDLGNSGQIERDADCVMLIHHGEINGEDGVYLLLEKNRDGATGVTPVRFVKEYYGFFEIDGRY